MSGPTVKLRWTFVPRATPATPSDMRRARMAQVQRADGSIVEYRIDPSRDIYCTHWIVSADGTPIATSRSVVAAMRTIERGVQIAGRAAA